MNAGTRLDAVALRRRSGGGPEVCRELGGVRPRDGRVPIAHACAGSKLVRISAPGWAQATAHPVFEKSEPRHLALRADGLVERDRHGDRVVGRRGVGADLLELPDVVGRASRRRGVSGQIVFDVRAFRT